MASPRKIPCVLAPPPPATESVRLELAGGATTVRVARFERARFTLRVVAIDPCSTVLRWCAENDAEHAIVGGFYMRPGGPPLGDLRIGGRALPSRPFDPPWGERRACVHADRGQVTLAHRDELDPEPPGDLLQAGPMLVAGGRSLIRRGEDAEGFSAGSDQFDSDITDGRYPRAALGLGRGGADRDRLRRPRRRRGGPRRWASWRRRWSTSAPREAINLDGGGSASLVVGGVLRNTPREEHGQELVGGRDVATALAFVPR